MSFPEVCRIVLSGPFCCGKTTIREMLERDGIPKLIDDSTRPMRRDENQGFPYHFISKEEFENNKSNGYYFEAVVFNGNHYGVPRDVLFNRPKWSLDLLSKSWKHYKNIPNVVGIYLEPPSVDELVKRAQARGDTNEHIIKRIASLKDEDSSDFEHRIPPQKTIEDTYAVVKRILMNAQVLTQTR